MKLNDEERYNEILAEAHLYLGQELIDGQYIQTSEGYSFRQIADKRGFSHVTIYTNLTKALKDYNLGLYERVIDKIESKSFEEIKNPEVQARVLKAYKLLMENNTIEQITKILGSKYYITYRDLTKRLEILHNIAPEVVTEQMLDNVKQVFFEHKNANLKVR